MKTAAGAARDINRRRSGRHPVMVLEVKGKHGDKIFVAYAENLGPGGLHLSSSHPLQVGDQFPIEFVLPDQTTTVTCSGKVVWKKEMGSHSDGVGIRFMDVPDQAKKSIGAWIDKKDRKK